MTKTKPERSLRMALEIPECFALDSCVPKYKWSAWIEILATDGWTAKVGHMMNGMALSMTYNPTCWTLDAMRSVNTTVFDVAGWAGVM